MIYLDSSAVLKLLFEELESEALGQWLSKRTASPLVSSELAKIEVVRACRRLDEGVLPEARNLLSQLDLIPLSGSVVDESAEVGGTTLRSLDAIHLASALSIVDELSAFVAYDHRLNDAADTAGLVCVRPGA